jgi:serine protease AprX
VSKTITFVDTFVPAKPDDLVFFMVVSHPPSPMDSRKFRELLTLRTLKEVHPIESTVVHVRQQLNDKGFEVFSTNSGPPRTGYKPSVVSARGTALQFEQVFATTVEKRIRKFTTDFSEYSVTSVVLRKDAPAPSVSAIQGAFLVVIAARPTFVSPMVPIVMGGFNLHLPGDIAQWTKSAAVHRRRVPGGDRATGGGIGVAILDSGFAHHPYFDAHDYTILRHSAPDIEGNPDPAVDEEPHGTCLLPNLFACAPDVDAYAIKKGPIDVLSLDFAMTFPISVISISWVHDLPGVTELPDDLIPLQLALLDIISLNVTVVAAAGNSQISFPAMMPEVIAVGGAAVDDSDALVVWDRSSSFVSPLNTRRTVPDFCGIASSMLLPIPDPPGWMSRNGTSFAAPQVAGVAALLVQKNPLLTPQEIRSCLYENALDIEAGISGTGNVAGRYPDLATGAGLVDAARAWNAV